MTPGIEATWQARIENKQVDRQLQKERKRWSFKPSRMRVVLKRRVGAFAPGLVLSVSHEVGCMLLHKYMASILERDLVTVDAVIRGELEQAIEMLGLGATE